MSTRNIIAIGIFGTIWLAGLVATIYIDKHPKKTASEIEWERLEASDATNNTVTCNQLGKTQMGYTFYEVFSHNDRYLLVENANHAIALVENK